MTATGALQIPTRPLAGGGTIPLVGLGTWPLDDATAPAAVANALGLGYRLIDTAARYGNEVGVGRGIRDAGVPREELVVTTKLRGADHGRDKVRPALEASLERLGLDHADLYLIHWPLPRLDLYVESYEAMLELADEGLVGAVGVSNFLPHHIERLISATGVAPAVDQIQLSPALARVGLRAWLEEHGVVPQAWSPLGRSEGVPGQPVVAQVAAAHGLTVEQVILRWEVQQGIVVIPKSGDPARQRSNADIFDVELTTEEMALLRALDLGDDAGADPDVHEEF